MAGAGGGGGNTWAEVLEKKIGEYTGTNVKFSDLMDAAQRNFQEINKSVTEGKNDMAEKLKIAQTELSGQMKTRKEIIMKALDDQYKSIYSENQYNKAKVDGFQKSVNQALDEVADKTNQQYKDAMEKMKIYQGKTKEDFNKYYNDTKVKLNNFYDEAIKKIQP